MASNAGLALPEARSKPELVPEARSKPELVPEVRSKPEVAPAFEVGVVPPEEGGVEA